MLMRSDPFRELDRLTQQVFGNATRTPAAMPMDAYRQGEQFVVHFDLPGVDPSSVELTVEKNVLTVKAERKAEFGQGTDVLVAERPTGQFSRQLFLGENLNTEAIQANYDKGVLSLTIPVAERAKPRNIEITSNAAGPQVVEAQSARS